MKTEREFSEELDYIQSVNPANPGATFNNDSDCFTRYVSMQAKQAFKFGYFKISAEMLIWILK